MLIINDNKDKYRDVIIKYFVIQSIGSIFILIFWGNNFNYFFYSTLFLKIFMFILIMSLMLKIAMAPFHSWIPKIIKNLSFVLLMILLLWQKLIPITLIININFYCGIVMISLIAIVIGSLGQMNIRSIVLIMIFSSIVHIRWMMVSRGSVIYGRIIYLFFYFVLSFFIIKYLFECNVKFLWNQYFQSRFLKFSLLIYSLAGVPPLLGFIPKWIVINNMVNIVIVLLLFIILTGLNFFIYNRMIYRRNLIVSDINFNIIKNKNFSFNMINLNFMLPVGFFFLI